MTLDDWVLTCRAAGYMPVLTAMRASPGWLAGKYAGEAGLQRFRNILDTTWRAECVSFGAMPG